MWCRVKLYWLYKVRWYRLHLVCCSAYPRLMCCEHSPRPQNTAELVRAYYLKYCRFVFFFLKNVRPFKCESFWLQFVQAFVQWLWFFDIFVFCFMVYFRLCVHCCSYNKEHSMAKVSDQPLIEKVNSITSIHFIDRKKEKQFIYTVTQANYN